MNIRTTTLIRNTIASLIIFVLQGVSAAGTDADTLGQYEYFQPPLTSLKCNEFTFDATKSQLPQSQNISYFWDFGDGNTSLEPIVSHTYQKSGDYTVNLSITDNSGFECSSAMTTQNVRVNIPPKISIITNDQSCVNTPIQFDSTVSSSRGEENLKYSWNFSDGTTSKRKRKTTKSYAKGGDYKVFLTVDDQTGTACSMNTAEKMIHINEPPQAQAGKHTILRCVSDADDMTVDFDASATTDNNNDPLTYLWEFGDGTKDTGKTVSHHYNEVKHYDAKLIVSDNTNLGCGTSVDFVNVKFNHAPRAIAGDDTIACVGEEVSFDGSRSYIHKKGTAVAQWFFGDGLSKRGLKTTHRYRQPGTYQAILSLENKLNIMCPASRDTRVVTINSTPLVNIQSVYTECAGKKILFNASSAVDSDGDDLKYYWNFGDGATVEGNAKITHQYAHGGTYRVSIIVDDQKGTQCSSVTAQTTIHINTPPIADAGPNHACCVDKVESYSASASSDPDGNQLSYYWDFGDGIQEEGENVEHFYRKEGSYNVVLTVDDNRQTSCSRSTDSFIAEVKKAPRPVINVR